MDDDDDGVYMSTVRYTMED